MTSEQRQQRIEAAAKAFGTLPWPAISTLDFPERIARALDAADRAVPVVGKDEAEESHVERMARCVEALGEQQERAERAEAALAAVEAGGAVICEDTGQLARDGVCPVHEGDACLIVPSVYVGRYREVQTALVKAEAAAREFGELLRHVEQTLDAGTWLDMATVALHEIRRALAKHPEFSEERP